MDQDEGEAHKNTKRERGQYLVILTNLAWSIKDLLDGIKSRWSSYSCLFWSTEKEASYTQKWWRVSLFSFSSSIPTEKYQKISLLPCNSKENFRAPVWTGTKREIPSEEYRSQSQREIWFLLPTHGASHIIKRRSVVFHAACLLCFFQTKDHFETNCAYLNERYMSGKLNIRNPWQKDQI